MPNPRRERIPFVFGLDVDGKIEKLVSARLPHANLNGDFEWELINNVGTQIDVSLKNFSNTNGENVNDYLTFNPRSVSATVPADDSGFIRAKVKKVKPGQQIKFKYEVYIGTTLIDPELEIDGGGGILPKAARKGGGKKR